MDSELHAHYQQAGSAGTLLTSLVSCAVQRTNPSKLKARSLCLQVHLQVNRSSEALLYLDCLQSNDLWWKAEVLDIRSLGSLT